MKIAKSVLCKIISCEDIIFNKQFRAPTIHRQVLIFVDKFCWFFFHQLQAGVLKNICSKRNCNRNSRSVNFPCEYDFSLKRPVISMNYFKHVFQEFWSQIKKNIIQNISYRTVIFEQNWTFLFWKFVCTWLLILHAMIQSLKKSRVVALEFFSIELIEVIVQKCSKKRCFSKYWKNLQENTHSEIQLQI